jgi:hypothetical protein
MRYVIEYAVLEERKHAEEKRVRKETLPNVTPFTAYPHDYDVILRLTA